jgi:hypothetical protein
MGPVPPGPMSEEDCLEIQAFLDWLEPGDRYLWEDMMCDRTPLVEALRELPRTFLHGDPGPRNGGLRWPPGGEHGVSGSTELVLIDWEWAGVGPAALDLGPVVMKLPLICDPTQPMPEACWSNELPDFYFERYRAAGGTQLDREACRRSCDLGLAVWWLFDGPGVGRAVLAEQGLAPSLQLAGVSEDVRKALLGALLAWARRTTDKVTETAKRWLA